MKKVLLLITITIVSMSYSQCDKVKKTYDEMKDITRISAPSENNFSLLTGMPKKRYELQASVVLSKGEKINMIYFTGYGTISLIGDEGLYVKLSNGDVLRYEKTEVSSRYVSTNLYVYLCGISVSDQEFKKFAENSVTNFDISFQKYEVKEKDSLKFKSTVACIIDKSNFQ